MKRPNPWSPLVDPPYSTSRHVALWQERDVTSRSTRCSTLENPVRRCRRRRGVRVLGRNTTEEGFENDLDRSRCCAHPAEGGCSLRRTHQTAPGLHRDAVQELHVELAAARRAPS